VSTAGCAAHTAELDGWVDALERHALFEGDGARHRFSQRDMNRLAAASLGESWRRFVRTHSRADDWRLTVVHVSLDPSHARRW
jgi:hypothetical protein